MSAPKIVTKILLELFFLRISPYLSRFLGNDNQHGYHRFCLFRLIFFPFGLLCDDRRCGTSLNSLFIMFSSAFIRRHEDRYITMGEFDTIISK